MLLIQNVAHKMHRTQSPQPLALPQAQTQAQARLCSSPAVSEISVGSPSPPPATVFRPLSVKRLRLLRECPAAEPQRQQQQQQPPAETATRRKSTGERVKSFSIADILGKRDETPPTPKPAATADATSMASGTNPLLNERLQPPVPPTLSEPSPSALPLPLQPPPPPIASATWDPVRGAMTHPSLHPFFSPALLHSYEQRLAWDYQRQLQEHFQAQAQLLRQMSMDPTIIPSEDGSDERSHSRSRSRSSSTGSGDDCCSPDVEVVEAGKPSSETSQSVDNKAAAQQQQQQPAGGRLHSSKTAANDTPLDALFQLSTKNFDEEQDPATLNIFATRSNPKKKRKSRTAFTNHQIFELEKRFLYQKYLSPADRDEIAAGLGLSNAQVITWFQNRRAKLKRDMEELKKDVETVKQLSGHKSFLENVNDLSILKTRPVSRQQQQQQPSASLLPTLAASSSALTCFITLPTHVVNGSDSAEQQQQQQQQQQLQQPQPQPDQQQQQQQQPQQRG